MTFDQAVTAMPAAARNEDAVWQMPVARVDLRLALERTPRLDPRAGANLSTTLRGLLLRHCVQQACSDAVTCSQPQHCRRSGCDAGWLMAPRSEAQRRDHAMPIRLLITAADTTTIQLQVVVWGRRAGSRLAAIGQSFVTAGNSGLIDRSGRVRWTVAQQAPSVHRLGDLARPGGAMPTQLWALISGLSAPNVNVLERQLPNLAHDVTQFALADSGLDQKLGKPQCDALADQARTRVLQGMDAVVLHWHEAEFLNIGARRSCTNDHSFDLSGISGLASIEGDLSPIAPWLVVSTLWGLGGRKSFGMGRVQFFQGEDRPWPHLSTQAEKPLIRASRSTIHS